MIANSRALRILSALALTTLGCLYFIHVERTQLPFNTDLDGQLAGARYLVHGQNPYALIGPDKAFRWPSTLYHPFPTLLVLTPLAALSVEHARLVFVALTSFLFLYALGGMREPWRFVSIFSKSYQSTLLAAQWSFVFAAAWLLPALAALAIVKPNIGAAVVGARVDRRWVIASLAGGAVLLAVSFIVRPSWPADWLASLQADPNRRVAVTVPGGFLLLLAALKWRRPEARLLLALSLIPQTLGNYDALLLVAFVPVKAVECLALVALSHFSALMGMNDVGFNERIVASGTRIVLYLFLPSLLMILRRPNESPSRRIAE